MRNFVLALSLALFSSAGSAFTGDDLFDAYTQDEDPATSFAAASYTYGVLDALWGLSTRVDLRCPEIDKPPVLEMVMQVLASSSDLRSLPAHHAVVQAVLVAGICTSETRT